MNEEILKCKSFFAVKDIERDLINRKGLQNIWEEIDETTQDEIKSRWQEIIMEHFK